MTYRKTTDEWFEKYVDAAKEFDNQHGNKYGKLFLLIDNGAVPNDVYEAAYALGLTTKKVHKNSLGAPEPSYPIKADIPTPMKELFYAYYKHFVDLPDQPYQEI